MMRKVTILLTIFLMIVFVTAANPQKSIHDTDLIRSVTPDQNITSKNAAPLKFEMKTSYNTSNVFRGTGGQQSTTLDQFCPTGSLFDQPPTLVAGDWSHYTSEQSPDLICYENFYGVAGIICDIHFWGLNMEYNGEWGDCEPSENPMPFEIIIYDDYNGAPGEIVQQYNPTIEGTPTGEFYDNFELYAYDYVLDPCIDLIDGWISIQGQGDANCWFLWTTHGEVGEGYALQNDSPIDDDLSLCLTGDLIDRYGACCDDNTGDCVDDILMGQCPPPLRWANNTACVDLVPECGMILGACCDDSNEICTDDVPQILCPPPLRWADGILCADIDPPCGCPEDILTVNIKTDDFPEETTWEVLIHNDSTIVASGGPLIDIQTVHSWEVCIESDGCYDFEIYDSFGDGICCDYGEGYYEIYLNSTLVASNYAWHTGIDEVREIGNGCNPSSTGRNIGQIPGRISICQNYPNPFNAQTTIQYSLPTQSDVIIEVYDILGQRIESLTEGQKQAGQYKLIWNTEGYPSGIYFYKFRAGDYIETRKIVLIK